LETITSVKNSIVLKTKEIKLKPDEKLFLESPKLIQEAYVSNKTFDYVLIQDNKYDKLINEYAFLGQVKTYLVGENVIASLCDTKSPQGIVAVINFEKQKIKRPENNFIVLDNIQDPGNLGTIIRSAKGTNFKDIYLINGVNFLNQKVIRSAMGNIFDINIYTFGSEQQFVDFAKENNLNLCVADMDGENIFNIKNKICNLGVVIGNEGNGVCKQIKDICKTKISIPMKNNLESLNAGVSCSIIIYYLDNIC